MLKVGKSFYAIIVGLCSLAVAIAHGFRAYHGWEMTYNGWAVPIALSWAIALVAFIMALLSFKNLR